MVIDVEKVTLQEVGAVGAGVRAEEFVLVTLEAFPDFPAEGHKSRVSKRDVFDPVPQIDLFGWIGEKFSS